MTRKVQIINRRDVFKKFIFRVEEVTLKHETYAGTMSEEKVRLNLDRGDAVAAVIYQPATNEVLFTEQFRYPTYENDEGWLLEIPAGMIRRKEDPAAAIRREVLEETGYTINEVRHLHTFYLSPGGTSERIFLYYASVSANDKTEEGGGVAFEGEDIKAIWLTLPVIEKMIENGEIMDAKTIVGLQWLLTNQPYLNGE